MSKEITISDIEEEMVLSDPIINKFGNVLIPAGASLKLSHKQLLKIWNIHSIKIVDSQIEEFDEISEEQREIATKILNGKIKWEARNKWEEDLLDLGVLSIVKSLNRKKVNIEL